MLDTLGPISIISKLKTSVKVIFNYAVRFAGIAVFLMLIAGGFKYLTAGGDPKKAESAQKTITYAIFGLALLIGGFFILLFIEKFTGVEVTKFSISPTPIP